MASAEGVSVPRGMEYGQGCLTEKNSFRDEGSLFQILLALYLTVLLPQFVETESRCKFSRTIYSEIVGKGSGQ